MKLIKLIVGLLCLLCVFDMPYAYYQIFRITAFVAFLIFSYDHYKKINKIKSAKLYMFFWLVSALIVQPFFKLVIDRSTWNLIDLLWFVVLIESLINKRE